MCFGIRWLEPMRQKDVSRGPIPSLAVRAGVPLVILSALLFCSIPGVRGSRTVRLYHLFSAGFSLLLVNIPYGSLNASLTRDPESIDKLTSTRMMLANSANLLGVYLFPMFVQWPHQKTVA